MTLGTIIATSNGIGEFLKKDTTMPFKVSRAIAKNALALDAEIELFNKERTKLVEGFDDKTDEEKETIEAKFKEMIDTDVDVTIVKIEESDIEGIALSAKDIIALDFMIA